MVQLSLPALSQSGGGCRTSQAGDGGGWAGGAGRSGQSAGGRSRTAGVNNCSKEFVLKAAEKWDKEIERMYGPRSLCKIGEFTTCVLRWQQWITKQNC